MAIINVKSTGDWFQRFKGTAQSGNGSGSDANNPVTHLTFIEEIGEKTDAAVTNPVSAGSSIGILKGILSLFQSIVGQVNNNAVTDPTGSASVISLLKGLLSLSQKTQIVEYTYFGSSPVEIPAGARSYSIQNYGVSPVLVEDNLSASAYLDWEVDGETYKSYESGILWEKASDSLPTSSPILVDPNPLDGRSQTQVIRVSCSAPAGLQLAPPTLSLNTALSSYKTAIEADGASIDFNGLNVINDFVNTIDQAGALAKLDILWVPCRLTLPTELPTADLNIAARRCIKGGPLTFGGTANFSNVAYTGNGVKGTGLGVLRTGRTLDNYSQATGVSYGFYSKTTANTDDIWGTRQANNFAIWPKRSNGLTTFEHFTGIFNSSSVSTGRGFFGLSRVPNSPTIFSWVNGAKFQENSLPSVTFSSGNLQIPFFGILTSGNYSSLSSRECPLAFIGQGLTEAELGAIATATLTLAGQLGW